ncbi:MAG TPA: efflux RND transporter periplasmic adaptor subunit [Acidobacteriota bacterium]|nr:efflux RND transporter periplasmic adaptor subunit [Acidobacteriota bacterium]
MTHRTRFVLCAALLATAFGQWRCSGSGGQANTDPISKAAPELIIKASPVDLRDWAVTVPVSGSLHSDSIVEVKSEVGGRLIATHFSEGDLVQRDQLLAEIDPTNYRLALDQAKAALVVAQAGLERAKVSADHARRESQRADNLLKSGGITERDHQAAETLVKETEAQVGLADAQCGQAKAAISIAEKALRDCRILAPAPGHVQKRFFDSGSYLMPASSVYTLVDNLRLELECLVPSYRLAELRLGQRSVFTTPTWGERRFEGRITAINPMVEADNRSVRVKVRMSNAGGELRSGMYARGEIEIRHERNALVVPRSALLSEKEESSAGSVFVIKDGKAARRPVQIGGIQQDQVWVIRGLRQGELVIEEIGPALKEGSAVRPQSQAPVPGY